MENVRRKKLYLIDGPNMAFRAFFSVRGMSNSRGLPTNALFGFSGMLLKLIRTETPDYLGIVWDPRGGTFRQEIFPEYKGTRPDMPESLSEQMPWFRKIAETLDIPFLVEDGFEADDVMGTLARRFSPAVDVVLVSSDKDLMQLVGDGVSMLDTMKDRRIGLNEVFEKFGCSPDLVPDALALIGDSSDNIPGVRGIGEKGAKKLLSQYDGLDAIYAEIDTITPPGIQKKLAAGKEQAYLSRKLATIRRDVPVEIELGQLTLFWPPAEGPARELFSELEFRSLLKEFGGDMQEVDRSGYLLITREGQLEDVLSEIATAQRIALDTETTGLDAMRAGLVGLSLCWDRNSACYIPVGHEGLDSLKQLDWETTKARLGPILSAREKVLTGQNLKYDLKVLRRHGLKIDSIGGDTLVADALIEPDRRSHRLDDIALVHLGHKMLSFSDTIGDRDSFAMVDLEQARDYAAEDAHVAYLLDEKLHQRLHQEGLWNLYSEVEIPLVGVLTRMEFEGILLDREQLELLSEELGAGIAEAQARCFELAGHSFNVSSVKQLRTVLFEELKLPVVRSTKTGPSTNEAVLNELAEVHPLPEAILAYRSLLKLKNTYADPLPGMIHPETGRIHTHFSQTTTATGRLSSTDPNLQNIPIRTEIGRRIRKAFIAPEGRILISADYSQVELRVLAHLCGGTGGFARAFAEGRDVHTQTAAELLGIPPDMVSREQRSLAKAVNFGIIYGQSAYGLARSQRISRAEAREYIEKYKERFPEIDQFKRSTLEFARERGYVETILGRRRPVDLQGGNFSQRSAAERVAVNTPVQGSAADIIKKAMIAVDSRLRREFPGQKMLLQVHDELVLEVDEGVADRVSDMLREEMVGAIELEVPLVVEIGKGPNWDEAH